MINKSCIRAPVLLNLLNSLGKIDKMLGTKIWYAQYEPPHDKTNIMACAFSEDSDQPGHPPSLISLHCPHEESFGP